MAEQDYAEKYTVAQDNLLAVEYETVLKALTKHLLDIVDGKVTCTDSERWVLSEGLRCACAVHYGIEDDVEDVRETFESALQEHRVIDELTKQHMVKLFDTE